MVKNLHKNDVTSKNSMLLSYLIILLMVYPVFLIVLILFNITKWNELGNFGSLLSGTLGPLVTSITGVLLYTSIKEQRNAFLEQIKANEISVQNQNYSITVNEITSIAKDKKEDIQFLKNVIKKFPTIEDKWHHDGDPETYLDEDNEVQKKGPFKRMSDFDWLRLIAITNRLEVCFRECKKLKVHSDFPLLCITRIYGIDEYNICMKSISKKLNEIQSNDDKYLEDNFRIRFDRLESYIMMKK